jgi:futalosine hydrolase
MLYFLAPSQQLGGRQMNMPDIRQGANVGNSCHLNSIRFCFNLAETLPRMNCLIVAATSLEIKMFIQHCRTTEKLNHIDLQLDFLITGVGMLNTSYALLKHVQVKQPHVVVNAGIAGSFSTKYAPGSVVVVKDEVIADLGVTEKDGYKDLFDLKLQQASQFPFTKKKLSNPHTVMIQRTKLPAVTGISVNQITTSGKTAELYTTKYKAVIENMEGAAVHYVCLREQIPFVQIRSISNYVGDRNKKNWMMDEAVKNLNTELIRLVESL